MTSTEDTMPKGIQRFAPNATFGLRLIEGEGSATGTTTPAKEAENPGAKPGEQATQQPSNDEQLGENGKKALDREREARRALEGQMTQMREAFAAALGIKQDGKADPNEAIADLAQKVTDMQHENAVLRLANQHNITDEGDLALLRATKDDQALGALASRLAGSEEERPKTPKPDSTQGTRDEGDQKVQAAPGLPRLRAAVTEQLATKN